MTLYDMQSFTSPTSGVRTAHEMIADLVTYIRGDLDGFYRLIIGTDSLVKTVNGVKQCDFVTAVVVHKVGSGARYFWQKEKLMRAPSLREKIFTETYHSLQAANILVPDLKKELIGVNYELEIHIDVGNAGPTREMIKEVVGMVVGNGYTAKTKPDSWAASKVADKYT